MMQTCHTLTRTLRLFPETTYAGTRCAIQHVSAHRTIGRLGHVVRSDRVAPARQAARLFAQIGFAQNVATTERRRHACHSHLSPSSPLQCSLLSLRARSRKSQWKNQWLWKSHTWTSSKLAYWSGANVARPQQNRRQLCQLQLNQYWQSVCLPSSPLVLNKKKLFLSSLSRSWQSRPLASTKLFFWPGASRARPYSLPAFPGGVPC